MTLKERLRQLASALPSEDSAVTITRAGLIALDNLLADPLPVHGGVRVAVTSHSGHRPGGIGRRGEERRHSTKLVDVRLKLVPLRGIRAPYVAFTRRGRIS